MPWKVALDHIKDRPETYLDIPSFSPGVSDGSYQAKFPTGHEGARMVDTQEQMRKELDEIHVDIGVLFPDHLLKLPVLTQVEYPAALARAYNAWLLDKWCSVEKGLLGLVVACTQDPEDAAREIEKYAKTPEIVTVSTIPSTRRRRQRTCRCCCTASPLPIRCSPLTTRASTRSLVGILVATRSP
jgi:predicted TIM-barrel fold metal-dependent hydrolase